MMQEESDAHSVSCSGAPPHLPSLTLGNFYKNQHLSGKWKGWLSLSTLSTMGVSCRRVETCHSRFWQREWTQWPLQAYLVSAYLKGIYDPDTEHPLPQSEQLHSKVDLCEACCGDLINSLLGISCLLPRNHLSLPGTVLTMSNSLNSTYQSLALLKSLVVFLCRPGPLFLHLTNGYFLF